MWAYGLKKLNFVYKTRVLASENVVFLNSKSDGRKYAKFEKVLNPLIINHFCFLDISLASQKGLFTLQREPSDTLKRLFSPAHKALFGEQNGSFWSVKRLSL